jgi:hypothetical protein
VVPWVLVLRSGPMIDIYGSPLESLHFLRSPKRETVIWEKKCVAAFCACCGAEITLKPEAPVPQHGMAQPDLLLPLDFDTDPSQEDVRRVGS